MGEKEEILKQLNKYTTRPNGTQRAFYHPAFGLPHISTPIQDKQAFNRFKVILDRCDPTKRFFVGGSNAGYTAFQMVSRGGTAVGVESHRDMYEVATLISRYNGFKADNPLFVHTTVEKFLESDTRDFDYGIMLMILHHMWRVSEEGAFKALNTLASRAPIIFLQCRTRERDPIPSYEELPDYIVDHSILDRYERLYPEKPYLHDGVPMYLFYS